MNKFPKKILIIRLGAIGDVLHTYKVANSIKQAHPETEIKFLTGKVPAKMIKFCPDLDEVLIFGKNNYKNIIKTGLALRKENFDLIVNLQPSTKLRLLAFLTGAKKTLNYKKNPDIHAVKNFFDTVGNEYPELEFTNELKITIPEKIFEEVDPKLPSGKFVVIAPMAGPVREGKKWRSEYFKELALKIIEKYNVHIIFSGSSDEKERLEEFEKLHPKTRVIAGEFDILQSAAMFSRATYVIGADTGPLHIATATRNPVCIGLYGAMAIYRTGLVGEKNYSVKADNLGCIPCKARYCKIKRGEFSPCMDAITPEKVFEIIEKDGALEKFSTHENQ